MGTIILLNGGSSSGKTTLAKALQASLPNAWLHFGIDDLIDAMPSSMLVSESGILFDSNGEVVPGENFRILEWAWMNGIAEMAKQGANLLIDDVLLSGASGQMRWQSAMQGLTVLWVGVHCHPETAAERELSRPDRTVGMAVSQARVVHQGVRYDCTVDTSVMSLDECVQIIIHKLHELQL